jgi:hypothetical protein
MSIVPKLYGAIVLKSYRWNVHDLNLSAIEVKSKVLIVLFHSVAKMFDELWTMVWVAAV